MLDNIIGSNKTIQHLPIGSLKGFGTNPSGDAIYRVVWSESILGMSGGKHQIFSGEPAKDAEFKANGGKDPNQIREEIGYKWIPVYPGICAWVLEKWKSAFAYTGMTQDMWNWQYKDLETGLLELGPYPIRGEYSHSYTFPETPGYMRVAEVIQMVEFGHLNYTLADHKSAILSHEEKNRKAWEDAYMARAKEALPVGGIRPINLRPGKQNFDNINFNYAHEQVAVNPAHRGASVG
jgi:hypothetical protein